MGMAVEALSRHAQGITAVKARKLLLVTVVVSMSAF
jgi:hypothetical protein